MCPNCIQAEEETIVRIPISTTAVGTKKKKKMPKSSENPRKSGGKSQKKRPLEVSTSSGVVMDEEVGSVVENPSSKKKQKSDEKSPDVGGKPKKQKKDGRCMASKCKKSEFLKNLLKCSLCDKTFHAKCCNPPLNPALAKHGEWQCNDCRRCLKCSTPGDESSLVVCDACDRSYHIYCLRPALDNTPDTEWFCEHCVNCRSCRVNLDPPTRSRAKFWQGSRVCEGCFGKYRNKEYCPICVKIYQDHERNFIGCDRCNLWVHADCDGISESRLKEMNQKDQTYICKPCREQKS